VRYACQGRCSRLAQRLFAMAAIILFLCRGTRLFAQMPYIGTGPDSMMAQIDFAEMTLEQQSQRAKQSEQAKAQNKELVASGAASALDLEAPNNAIELFNRGGNALKARKSEEAVKDLLKAIQDYPKFVSAYVVLGRAYLDLDDTAHAKAEFENAARLDNKYALPFVNLGQLAMASNDYSAAQSNLEKAAALRPKDARILTTLAYAENGNHSYQQALETVQRVHALDHKGLGNVHYVAASAAQSLKDYAAMERELTMFLNEAPASEYAAIARKNLDALEQNKTILAANAISQQPGALATAGTVTFPNSDRLKAQLSGLGDESECGNCAVPAGTNADTEVANSGPAPNSPSSLSRGNGGVWMIRKSVDDVAVFFSVSNHGHMINDLQESDIHILDDNKPPLKVMQFAPQSKLPLRLALLIDTSGSVQDRFSFEKNAAARFVDKVLNHSSDLAFIAGFSVDWIVTQDFSSDPKELSDGIHKLSNGGGTALFDAVSFACRKLAAYPETERVARVLVVLSDGEDNSSHNSLKQSLQAAERAGVTIYAISTREDRTEKSDADKVLSALAERSGGEAMFPGDVFTLTHSFDKLRDLIRSRYFVAYKPANFQPDGHYRTINISAEKDGKHFQVRARDGYHARWEGSPN
jgi:Ca-activated chloride channel homolog